MAVVTRGLFGGRELFNVFLDWSPNPLDIAVRLRAIDRFMGDFGKPLRRAVREVVIPSIDQNFAVEGRPAWPPLAASTVRKKGHDRVLHESGALRSRATSFGAWEFSDREGDAWVSTLGLPYEWVHQAGYRFIPKREYMMIQAEDVDQIAEKFEEHVDDALRRALD